MAAIPLDDALGAVASIGLEDCGLPATDASSRKYNPQIYVVRREWAWKKRPGGWLVTPGPEIRELAPIGMYPLADVLAAMRGQPKQRVPS